MPTPKPTRRSALALVASLPLAGCVVAEPGDDDDTPRGPEPLPDEPVDVGAVAEIGVNTLRVVSGAPLAIGRGSDGLWAVGLTCTHLGCNIGDRDLGGDVRPDGIRCGCHGSQYGPDGDVRVGPSVRDLANYRVTIDAGRVLIDPMDEVPLGTRTPAG